MICGFRSWRESPFQRQMFIYRISPQGGMPEKLAVGPGNFVSFGPLGGGARQNPPRVLQRHGYGYPTWKRGGTAGEIWVDAHGTWRFFKAPFLDQQHTPAFVDRKSDLLPIGP